MATVSTTRCNWRSRRPPVRPSCSVWTPRTPPMRSPRPLWTTCRWPRCTPNLCRPGRASRRPSPGCAPCTRPCSPAAESPAPEPFRGSQRPGRLFDQPIDMRTSDRSLTAVEQTYLKQYCSLIHGQVIIDATLALRDEHAIIAADVATVTLEVFQGAFDIAGGGRYGDKDHPRPKSRPTTTSNTLWRSPCWTARSAPNSSRPSASAAPTSGPAGTGRRHRRARPDRGLSGAHRGPRPHRPASDGREFIANNPTSKDRPRGRCHGIGWSRKFHWLGEPFADAALRAEIIDAVARLDEISVADLARLLGCGQSRAARAVERGDDSNDPGSRKIASTHYLC